MRYLLLIYNNATTNAEFATEEGRARIDAAHAALNAELTASGELISTDPLAQDDARVVRTAEGRRLVTDGPFTETKEFVGGFYLVDVADEARAIEIAGRLEEARTSLVEVRRVGFSLPASD